MLSLIILTAADLSVEQDKIVATVLPLFSKLIIITYNVQFILCEYLNWEN
jgi:hypothetical protein